MKEWCAHCINSVRGVDGMSGKSLPWALSLRRRCQVAVTNACLHPKNACLQSPIHLSDGAEYVVSVVRVSGRVRPSG